MPVSTQHKQYSGSTARWKRNRDAVKGYDAIKMGGETYLPRPNADTGADADKRYANYLSRAMWYASPERTKNSLVGMVFRKGPEKQEIPSQIEYITENATGSGESLEQVGKKVVGEQLEAARIGILVDFPAAPADRAPTLEDDQSAERRAYLSLYAAESIINWRTEKRGGKVYTSLVVLQETKTVVQADGFDTKEETQYRVLRLVGGLYEQALYDDKGSQIELILPTNSKADRWTEIPFIIAGSETNTLDVDEAPLRHLVDKAIAYWQVSADHRENLFMHGQLTLGVQSSLDEKTWKEMNPDGIRVGATSGIFLGTDGAFHTATIPESTSLSKALEDLRTEMAELGAQIVTKGGQAETAEAARIDAAAESSVLSTVVGNASEAIEQALEWVAEFMGADREQVEYALNTEFFDDTLDPQERTVMLNELDRGIIAKKDYRRLLRAKDIIASDRTDEEIDAEAETEPPLGMAGREDEEDNAGGA